MEVDLAVDSQSKSNVAATRIRVLQLGVSLSIGGSEQLAASIGQGLDPLEYDVSFAAIGSDGPIGERLRKQGFSTQAFCRKEGFDRSLFWRIWNCVRQRRIEIVQSHHLSSLIYGGIPARLAGAKLVHTEHEVKTYEKSPRNLHWLQYLHRLVHRFVTIDESIADFLVAKVPIARSRITVIRNGIDVSRFQPRMSDRTTEQPFVVGWVGRLDPPKRPDLFVEAIGQLALRHPQIRARMVGPGVLFDKLRAQIDAAGLSDKVEMLGGRNDIPDLLRSMDAYVLASDAEGLPISLVEAMATGLPCIASSVGAIPKLIEHGKNGLILGDANADTLAGLLDELIDHPTRCKEMGRSGLNTVLERFDLRNTITQYSKLFAGLVRPDSTS